MASQMRIGRIQFALILTRQRKLKKIGWELLLLEAAHRVTRNSIQFERMLVRDCECEMQAAVEGLIAQYGPARRDRIPAGCGAVLHRRRGGEGCWTLPGILSMITLDRGSGVVAHRTNRYLS
jgi:hypothetical protein